jgi:hypothetical protein
MFTIKNLKYNAKLSEETLCFSCNLYLDGKKVAEVSNRGCGGCDDVHFVSKPAEAATMAAVQHSRSYDSDREVAREIRRRIEALSALGDAHYQIFTANPPPDEELLRDHQNVLTDYPWLDPSLETIVAELVAEELERRDMKKALRSRVIFQQNGSLFQSRAFSSKQATMVVAEQYAKKPGLAGAVLNLMPEADALAIWRGVAA